MSTNKVVKSGISILYQGEKEKKKFFWVNFTNYP